MAKISNGDILATRDGLPTKTMSRSSLSYHKLPHSSQSRIQQGVRGGKEFTPTCPSLLGTEPYSLTLSRHSVSIFPSRCQLLTSLNAVAHTLMAITWGLHGSHPRSSSGCLKHTLSEVGYQCGNTYYDKIDADQIVKDFWEDHYYDAKDEGKYSHYQSCH